MSGKRTMCWFPETLINQLKSRGQISEVSRESLTRYFAMLGWNRRELKDKFTPGELSFLADICNGTMFTGGMIPLGLLADAQDAESEFYDKWEVDRKTLLDKLTKLSPCQEATLVDAIERFWEGVSSKPSLEQPEPGKLLE